VASLLESDGLSLLESGTMYPMSQFRLTGDSVPFPFPECLLSTESFMPFLPSTSSRRLKNVSVMMFWTSESGTRYVLVSLAEAESLRKIILRDTKLHLKQRVQLSAVDCATLAIPLTPEIVSIETPRRPEGMMSDAVGSVLFKEQLHAAHAVRACDTAIISSIFFNNAIHFNDSAIVALITVFESVSLDRRIDYFNKVLCCRLRDQASWECSSVANFFTHQKAHDIRKVFDLRATLVRAIVKEMKADSQRLPSLRHFYEFMCDPKTRLMTAKSLSAAIEKFRQNSSLLSSLHADNLSELLKFYSGANALSWLQFQRLVSIEFHENHSDHADLEDSTSPFSPKATAGSLDVLMQNLSLADMRYVFAKIVCL
jgi:hypothetical protein